jgi:hypothetical protein
MVITCKKCPWIKGDTYCNKHKKETWKEDDMCEDGYYARINKGMKMCCALYKEFEDDPKIPVILEQVKELDRIYQEKFAKKYNGIDKWNIDPLPEVWKRKLPPHKSGIEEIEDDKEDAPF